MTLTFDLKIYRAHPWLMGRLHVKFHDDRCKKKVVMRRKPFSVIYALWPWPFDLKIYRAHPWLMGSLHVKFYDDRCKGRAVMLLLLIVVLRHIQWRDRWPVSKFWPAAGHPRHGQLGVFSVPSLLRHGHRDVRRRLLPPCHQRAHTPWG